MIHEDIKLIGQKPNYTEYNRHPYLFTSMVNLNPNCKSLLSFGCSIGKEAQSIRDIYYKDKSIIIHGLDVRKDNINYANQNVSKELNIQFFTYDDFIPMEYECIVACHCLCHYKLGLDKWINTVNSILNMLKVGGIFIFHDTTYDITKTILNNRVEIATINDYYALS